MTRYGFNFQWLFRRDDEAPDNNARRIRSQGARPRRGSARADLPCSYDGRWWDFQGLREFCTPWREVAARGVSVHIGEFGCFAATSDDVAVRWFADLLAAFREFRWGWALWEFEGPFGVVGHGREGAHFEPHDGYLVDRRLLDLLTP
ncbi:hypothetical protein ACFQX7_37255 [Luedemannella flava]